MRRIQGDFDRRNTQAVTKGLAFNAAHDSARDDFLLELVARSSTITGLPVPQTPATRAVPEERGLSPTTEVALRRQVAAHGIAATLASGAGAAAAESETDPESAYSAVVAAAMLTPAPSAAHPVQQAGATARATRALLGGGTTHSGRTGIAAGTMLLTGFVASAASPLFAAGTLAWLARRSRRQNDQLRDRAGPGRGQPRRHPARLRRGHGHPWPRDPAHGLHRDARRPRAAPVACPAHHPGDPLVRPRT